MFLDVSRISGEGELSVLFSWSCPPTKPQRPGAAQRAAPRPRDGVIHNVYIPGRARGPAQCEAALHVLGRSVFAAGCPIASSRQRQTSVTGRPCAPRRHATCRGYRRRASHAASPQRAHRSPQVAPKLPAGPARPMQPAWAARRSQPRRVAAVLVPSGSPVPRD